MTTTLKEIKKHNPCHSGWKKLLKNLGKHGVDDEPLSLMYILESNGIRDATWCLRCAEGIDKEIRLFAIACIREVEHLMIDKKNIQVLDVVERFTNGYATANELIAAVKWIEATRNKHITNTADRASYNAAICVAHSNTPIGFLVFGITGNALHAISMEGTCLREKARDEALTRQKELFIQFFGKENT